MFQRISKDKQAIDQVCEQGDCYPIHIDDDYVYYENKNPILGMETIKELPDGVKPFAETYKANKQDFNKACGAIIVQYELDKTAKTFDFDDINTARTYAGYENQFQEQALKLAKWSSDVWSWFYKAFENTDKEYIAVLSNMPEYKD